MSINSINHDEMTNIAKQVGCWRRSIFQTRKENEVRWEARRRIEALRELESGLSLEEAGELGLIH